MAKGIVLIHLVAGEEKKAISRIAKLKGVKKVSGVFGSWDAIAEIQAKSIEDLAKVITSKIRKISEVADTETLIEVRI